MGYGDALITATYDADSDDSDDFPTDAGAPEFQLYGDTVEVAKFSFQDLGYTPSPQPTAPPYRPSHPQATAKPTSEPTIVKVDFCDSDDYDKLEVVVHIPHPSYQSCDTDGSWTTIGTSSYYTDYSDDDW